MVALEQFACAAPVVTTMAAKATRLSFAILCPPIFANQQAPAGSGQAARGWDNAQ
jgi:hypothetical protein